MVLDDKMLSGLDALERVHRLPDTCALKTSEAAIFLRCSISQMENMRRDGSGPTYIQAGGKDSTGFNQKCLYEKGDLLAWLATHKVRSIAGAAIRNGKMFASVLDLAQTEAFWIDTNGYVAGMVEMTPVKTVIERLSFWDVEWMSVIGAASRVWSSLYQHQAFATQIDEVLVSARSIIQASCIRTAVIKHVENCRIGDITSVHEIDA